MAFDMEIPMLIVAIILSFAVFFIPKKWQYLFGLLLHLIVIIATSILALDALTGSSVQTSALGYLLGNPIYLVVDRLSAFFVLVVNFTILTGVLYAGGYLKPYIEKKRKADMALHYFSFLWFHISMLLVCTVRDGLAFLIVWEIMSLSSLMLVIFDHQNPKTLKAGINYLVQMHLSITFLAIGFIWVYAQTGSFGFDAFLTYFGSNSNIWLFLIFFTGFGIKAGFVPLHTWLPHAHPAAPSHVSGVMSGVIVKLGIYGIFRVISYLKADFLLLGEIVVSISVLTGLYGILNAAIRRDFKQMLAYCTIENIGIIGIGIGLGLMGIGNGSAVLYYLGFGGALLHVLNHSLFKSLLFYSAGSVYQQTHTRDMDKLGGLIRKMPKTAILFLIGALAIGGLPPFNGFVSEFVLYCGLLEGLKSSDISQITLLVFTLAGLSIIGGISVLTFTKTFGTIFLGSERQTLHHQPVEVSPIMLIPQYLIIAVMLSVAFFPQFYLNAIGNLLEEMANGRIPMPASGLSGYSKSIANINLYFLLFMSIIAVSWFARSLVLRNRSVKMEPTWGCAYLAPNSRMQYTGKSFSKSLSKMFNFVLVEEKKYQELKPGEIFPKHRKHRSQYLDFFENRLIVFVTHQLVYAVNYFKFIQNGRVQSYVWYGIVFMLTIFVLTALNILK